MVQPQAPDPVKLFVAVLVSDTGFVQAVRERLESEFGSIDYESELFPFDVTDYYKAEMGEVIQRKFFSFTNLISPDGLADIKCRTNEIEQTFTAEGRRSVNLDPGYMDYYKIVLASGKFQGQKIYLSGGIYADLTLYYDKDWKPYAWGFPDFRSGRYNQALNRIRELYKAGRKVSTDFHER